MPPPLPTAPDTTWTPSQSAALERLRAFVAGEGDAFVLRGAAGTGKTTLLRALLAEARATGRPVHLTAPTARAARVASKRAGSAARTLHAHLYTPEPLRNRPGVRLVPKPNGDQGATLLVVDEASMLAHVRSSEDAFVAPRPILAEAVAHVRAGPEGGQVVFVGDSCQLPPVGESASVALCPAALASAYGLCVAEATLTDVVRQAEGSVVLDAAHALRAAMEAGADRPPALGLPRVWGRDAAVAAFVARFEADGPEAAVLLACANASVADLNARVRAALGRTGPLAAGDVVMLERDAYRLGAHGVRGALFEVASVSGGEEHAAGLAFRVATFRPAGEPTAPAYTTRYVAVLPGRVRPELTADEEAALYGERMTANDAFRLSRHPKDDAFVGALRLRYAYALTVHKAQGGEWDTVLLNPWTHPDTPPADALRWLYTAVTRARREAVMT